MGTQGGATSARGQLRIVRCMQSYKRGAKLLLWGRVRRRSYPSQDIYKLRRCRRFHWRGCWNRIASANNQVFVLRCQRCRWSHANNTEKRVSNFDSNGECQFEHLGIEKEDRQSEKW